MRPLARLAATVGLLAITLACSKPAADGDAASAPGTAATPAAAAGRDTGFIARADAGRIQGDSAAPVWLLVVSDFQCPFCKTWHDDTYGTLVREYVQPGKVRLAYLNLPLRSHQHAVPTAEAAMCAGVQGRFWAMHDAIFATQRRWSALPDVSATMDTLAQGIGVAMDPWRTCMRDRLTAPLVAADAERAQQIGVNSTPTFLVMRGGTPVRGLAGAFPADSFRVILDAALADAGR